MANARLNFIGEVTQIAGVAAVVAGVVLSLHHWPAAVALIGGGAAFYDGEKHRAQEGLEANRTRNLRTTTTRESPPRVNDYFNALPGHKEFHQTNDKYPPF